MVLCVLNPLEKHGADMEIVEEDAEDELQLINAGQ